MKLVTVIGARPQFIKAALVCRALRRAEHEEFIVHTGQHYDWPMSDVFFEELPIPEADTNLNVGSGSHGEQTAEMLRGIERILVEERPDAAIVYGDTNSTLAGALAAVKLHVPLIHVEAGLRSYNRDMPEEHNRVLTDHCADLLCCPTEVAVRNLAREGILDGVHLVGDTMADLLFESLERTSAPADTLARFAVRESKYCLATIHRAANTDDGDRLSRILQGLGEVEGPVILPLHPRTKERLDGRDGSSPAVPSNVSLIDPVGYLDMLILERHARLILTDSGGVQKEAFLLGVPCITLRAETEWTETVETGWNVLADADPARIVAASVKSDWPTEPPPPLYGSGDAAERIVRLIEGSLQSRGGEAS